QTYPNLEIMLIDNRSSVTEQVVETVRDYPRVRLILNEQNLGFTGGMNRGMREATGEYVLLSEDDLLLDPACVAEFVAFAQGQKEFKGLASGLMYNMGNGKIRCAGGDVSLGWTLRQSLRASEEEDRGQYREPFPVSYIA